MLGHLHNKSHYHPHLENPKNLKIQAQKCLPQQNEDNGMELQGLTRPKAIRNLMGNIRKYNLDTIFFFLSENMVPVECPLSIVNILGFYHFVSYPVLEKKWGLLLLWCSGVEVKPVHINMNAILVLIYLHITLGWSQCTSSKFKTSFWNHLDSTYQAFPGPCVCIGDFNVLLDKLEKLYGHPVPLSSIRGLKTLMENPRLIDIGFTGHAFTWTNNKHDNALIRERLDQGIANQQWRLLFPNATLHRLASSTSDHHLFLLHTCSYSTKNGIT